MIDEKWRELKPWKVFVVISALLTLITLATYLCLNAIPRSITAADAVGIRIEIVKISVTAVAGAVGIAVFWLTIRRQRLAERAQSHVERAQRVSEHDAAEKRITELYMKAADQLDSEKAAVRLAGLYAFERLAKADEHHRQTIVEVLCAFLRMPFTPPPPRKEDPGPANSKLWAEIESGNFVNPRTVLPPRQSTEFEAQYEIQEVRLAAQRILQRNLQKEGGWSGIAVDLSGATLVDFDFSGVCISDCRFVEADFHGRTTFKGAEFKGTADFTRSLFDVPNSIEMPNFDLAIFDQDALFNLSFSTAGWSFKQAIFRENLRFSQSYLAVGDFEGAEFFKGTTFSHGGFGVSNFRSATFHQAGQFGMVYFQHPANFEEAVFTGPAEISFVLLRGISFKNARFCDTLSINGQVKGHVDFENALYPPETDFSKLVLEGRDGKSYPGDRFPTGWTLIPHQQVGDRLTKAPTS